jgi:hypothetical protein
MAEKLQAFRARNLGKIGLRAGCQKPAGFGPQTIKVKKKKKVPRLVPHAQAVKAFKSEKWGRCKACKLMHLEPNQYQQAANSEGRVQRPNGAVEVDVDEYRAVVKPQLYGEAQLYYFNQRLDLFQPLKPGHVKDADDSTSHLSTKNLSRS